MKIIIYGHDFCIKCKEAIRIAREKDLDLIYINILDDDEVNKKLEELGVVMLPYILKDGESISIEDLRKL